MTASNSKTARWLFLFLILLLFVPWLGMSPFNTKGEPREAIVAVSILQSGDWILPVSFGTDIPFKPPFMAWLIALFSLVSGHVTEFTSRLPSALAAVALAMIVFCFVRRRNGSEIRGALTALVMVTSVEVWRAGMACRVDMLLTAFITGAFVCLYRYRENGYRRVPWFAVLLMSGGVLTKGPVGAILPCLVALVFGLVRGDRFWPLFGRLCLAGALSLIVPALWYWAAYRQGGEEFLQLVIEENFSRFTGNMSYSSHEKGLWYNFATVALGMLPYTLLAVMALFAVKWKSIGFHKSGIRRLGRWFREADAFTVFTVVATLTVFVFYCIPRSKRSVYLLPIYPFLAYYVVLLMRWLIDRKPILLRVYSGIIGVVALIVSVAVLALPLLPPEMTGLPVPSAGVRALGWIAAFISLLGGIYLSWILWMRRTVWCERTAIAVTFLTLITVSAGVLPSVALKKTDRDVAAEIEKKMPEGTVYSFDNNTLPRFYTVNFYLADRLRPYETELPLEGLMLVGADDLEEWKRIYGEIYTVEVVENFARKSCDRKQNMLLVRFSSDNSENETEKQ